MRIEYPEGSGQMVTVPGMPWRDVAATEPPRMPPRFGEHTDQVLRACNFGAASATG